MIAGRTRPGRMAHHRHRRCECSVSHRSERSSPFARDRNRGRGHCHDSVRGERRWQGLNEAGVAPGSGHPRSIGSRNHSLAGITFRTGGTHHRTGHAGNPPRTAIAPRGNSTARRHALARGATRKTDRPATSKTAPLITATGRREDAQKQHRQTQQRSLHGRILPERRHIPTDKNRLPAVEDFSDCVDFSATRSGRICWNQVDSIPTTLPERQSDFQFDTLNLNPYHFVIANMMQKDP